MSASVHAGIHHHPPPEVDTPLTRHPPWEQTPLDQAPPQSRHPPDQAPPGADTPQTRHATPTPCPPPPPGADTPPEQTPPREQTAAYGQRAAGSHPTGMHSCCIVLLYVKSAFLFFLYVYEHGQHFKIAMIYLGLVGLTQNSVISTR